jgi:uncharacterized protein
VCSDRQEYAGFPGLPGRTDSGRVRHALREREAAVPVHMELKRIIISEIHEQQVIMLREVDGERSFSIMIGIFEATSIDRRVKRLPSPRPLTHDLVASVIDSLGGELRDIYISELRDHTYYAKLRIRQNGEMVEVDSRPSDAIALAVRANTPIFAEESVLSEASILIKSDDEEREVEKFREFLDQVSPEDFQ